MSCVISLCARRASAVRGHRVFDQQQHQEGVVVRLHDAEPSARTREIQLVNRALAALKDDTLEPQEIWEWRDELEVISMHTNEPDIRRLCEFALNNS